MLDSIRKVLNELLDRVECRSRSIASLVVDKNGHIIGVGTNNPTCNCIENAQSKGYSFTDDGATCVRYLLGAKSGEMLDLCNARHAERTAIQDAHNHGHNTTGSSMYMTCECPCHLCADAIVKSGIKTIVIKDKPDYDPRGRETLTRGGVMIETWKEVV